MIVITYGQWERYFVDVAFISLDLQPDFITLLEKSKEE